jgi:hypothetical protein
MYKLHGTSHYGTTGIGQIMNMKSRFYISLQVQKTQ